jgi:hypothetical protein
MKIDFTKISDEEMTFELLNEGKHLLKVTKCEPKTSEKSNKFWAITYEDKDGTKIWDNLFFTEKTLNRVKKCFSNLGLDVSGEFDYAPDDILGLYMNAEIKIEDYVDKNGNKKQKNTIDLWQSEKYQKTGKKTTAKKVEVVTDDESSEIPF